MLQSAHLNWCEVAAKIKSLIRSVESKGEHIENPASCYFSHLDESIEVASASAGARYRTCQHN